MNKLDAQFTIMKSMSPAKEVAEDVVNGILAELENEIDKQYVQEWINDNGVIVQSGSRVAQGLGSGDEKIIALIRNRDSDKNLAVIGHEPVSSRVVGKIKDKVLQKLFERYVDKSVIVYEPEKINGSQLIRRKKIVPSNREYLKHLLSKFVITPYEVRWMKSYDSYDRLDNLVDNIYGEDVMKNGV